MRDLFIVCQNPKCGRRARVRNPYEVKRRRYCSRRCVGAMHGGVRHLSLADRLAAAEKSKQVRRAKAMAKLQGMTPIAIYRMAFSVGWKSGVRSARRRMGSVAA